MISFSIIANSCCQPFHSFVFFCLSLLRFGFRWERERERNGAATDLNWTITVIIMGENETTKALKIANAFVTPNAPNANSTIFVQLGERLHCLQRCRRMFPIMVFHLKWHWWVHPLFDGPIIASPNCNMPLAISASRSIACRSAGCDIADTLWHVSAVEDTMRRWIRHWTTTLPLWRT